MVSCGILLVLIREFKRFVERYPYRESVVSNCVLMVPYVRNNHYPLLSKILSDKFDYILIDEYQDTQKSVVQIFLEHIKGAVKNPVCIGFFGDEMQSIYANGVGNINTYVKSGAVKEIVKEDNYRCSVNVIELLNKVRSDIQQRPAKLNKDGTVANKTGSTIFLYSTQDFDLDIFQKSEYSSGWDFNNVKETKILFLTHRLNAKRLGFAELLNAYKYPDNLIGNEPDRFARHLLKIGGILYYYGLKDYSYVISKIDIKVNSNTDKKIASSILKKIIANQSTSIHSVIEKLSYKKIVRKDDRLAAHIQDHIEFYDSIKDLPISQVIAYYNYYNDFSPYSTQHGIKGAQFNNVLVIMDNGKWNQYNFKYYFEKTNGKEAIIARTEKLFYVCCSRAKENLILYYPNPTPDTLVSAEVLFGEKNMHKI